VQDSANVKSQKTTMRLEVWVREQLEDGRLVVTNTSNVGYQPGPEHTARAIAGAYDIPKGTRFTKLLAKLRAQKNGENSHETVEDIASISLTIVEVKFFRRMVDVVPNGHHAAIRVEGRGLELVGKWLAVKPENEHLYLSASS
jgi:hypothetical protein